MKKQVTEQAITRSRDLRHAMTDAERKLWSILSNRQMMGAKFRRQVPMGPYIADFASHEARLIIEADGGHHALDHAKDQKRTAFLECEGYRVLRFWNDQVLTNLDGVYATVADAVTERRTTVFTPTPSLPHRGGGRTAAGRKGGGLVSEAVGRAKA